jgi:hypothetical protein
VASPKDKTPHQDIMIFFMAAADVFMDTAGFLALWDAGDEHHAAALRLQAGLSLQRRHFLTPKYC